MSNIEILFSAVVAIATTVYTITTIFQLNDSRKTRLAKQTPFLLPYLKFTEDYEMLLFCIKNYGEGVAMNVKVKIIGEIPEYLNQKIKFENLGVVRHGLAYFPSQYGLEYIIAWNKTVAENNFSGCIELEVYYESIGNRQFCQKFELKVNELMGITYTVPPDSYMGQIPYYLNQINNTLKGKIGK